MCCAGYSERMVTTAQIAGRLGLTRAEAEALVGEAGFPAPVASVRSSSPPVREVPLWRWPDVRAFVGGRPYACAAAA